MLDERLEDIWKLSTSENKAKAMAKAINILGNLIHYPGGRNHYSEDVELLAAELLACQGKL